MANFPLKKRTFSFSQFHANFDIENESSRERKFQGLKVPGDKCSTYV